MALRGRLAVAISTLIICYSLFRPGGTLKPWPEFVEGLFGGGENPGGSLKRSLGMAPPCCYAPPQTKKGCKQLAHSPLV